MESRSGGPGLGSPGRRRTVDRGDIVPKKLRLSLSHTQGGGGGGGVIRIHRIL
jgi:hypothetical protein